MKNYSLAQKGGKAMKALFFITKDNKEYKIESKRTKKSYTAFYNGQEYSPLDEGTVIKFNVQDKIVMKNILVFDIEGVKFVTTYNNYACPKLIAENDAKVKCNTIRNNIAMSLNLLIGLIVFVTLILIISII